MGVDIARVTYDPTRQYRSVISQQGRVTLEADNNEAATLATEALRLETIDIIGPTGALGDGYKVGPGAAPGGISIDPGILYLGGWRLELDKAIDLPAPSDGDTKTGAKENLLVALLLTEQSVCAVEDQALREVALGGPDSAARSRLMQHFLRLPLDGDTCAAGAALIEGLLASDGVSVDPATLQLISQARLQAGVVPGPTNTDPCTPAAAGGYLGADNQMVRVTITAYDVTTKTGTLMWGWNNASLLYRATVVDPLTLKLSNTPVDEEHAPQLGQMVEILRTELDLGDGNFIAAHQGFVTAVAQAYSFDTQQVVLSSALPADYQNNKNPLFLRLWQASVPFTAAQPAALDSVSGITVTITLPVLPSHIAARPFWRFAVRPSTPQMIYPQRYADNPQPPDGPRQWITDLAVVQPFSKGGSNPLADCRVPYPPPAQSGQCCGLVLGPGDVTVRGGLQAVVDQLAGAPAVLSLRAGTYFLPAPLNFGAKHKGLTIEGCTDGVILQAGTGDPTPFLLGLIQFSAATDITLRKLEFIAPAVPANVSGLGLNTLVCISVQSCQELTIEQCLFNLVVAPAVTAFGSGILVYGPSGQVSVRRNTFAADISTGVFGVLAVVSGGNVSSGLDRWEISDNQFTNLWVAVLAFAELGPIRCCRNVVTGCGNGFAFVESNLGAASSFTRAAIQESAAGRNVALGQAANAALRADLLVDIVQKAAPFFAAMPPPSAPAAVSDIARQVLKDQMTASGLSAYRTLTGATGAPQTAAAASVEGASVDLSNFDKLDAISVAAEISAPALMPALRIDDNDLTLTTGGSGAWAGVVVSLSTEQPTSVIVNGNRVLVPDTSMPACAIGLFGGTVGAVVTGNLFLQPAATFKPASIQSLILLGQEIMVSANVVRSSELVMPQRTIQPAPGWDFLNTVG
jgi:uncharacterized protein DUF6519